MRRINTDTVTGWYVMYSSIMFLSKTETTAQSLSPNLNEWLLL
jgi:hypothetical protein